MSNELKPCPFCGGQAKVIDKWRVVCDTAGCCGSFFYSFGTLDRAVEGWNKRQSTELEAERAKVAKLRKAAMEYHHEDGTCSWGYDAGKSCPLCDWFLAEALA